MPYTKQQTMDLTQLKQIWGEHGFRAKKKFGQNFLVDNNVRDKIIRTLDLNKKSAVLEIGPGFGMMTFSLSEKCGKLFAVEKDTGICDIMGPFFAERENIRLVQGDIREIDICSTTGGIGKITVFGNIPYYISTPVIIKMIEQRKCVDNVYIVIQEELADRIVSSPGTKVYGSISCFVQFYTKPEKVFRIRKNSFYPVPKVGSSLLKLTILAEPSVKVKDKDLMFRIIRKVFSQRRKMIINPLKGFMRIDRGGWEQIFAACDIEASSRAENLALSDYARIADHVASLQKAGAMP